MVLVYGNDVPRVLELCASPSLLTPSLEAPEGFILVQTLQSWCRFEDDILAAPKIMVRSGSMDYLLPEMEAENEVAYEDD